MATLITVEQVAALRDGIEGDLLDILEDRLTAADAGFKAELRYDPVSAVATAYRCSGNGTRRLFLPRIPITAVASITVDAVSWPIYPTASAKAWIPPAEPGRHWLEAIAPNTWTGHQNNILITYTAGYATTSPEIAQMGEAVAQLALLLYDERKRLGLGSKTLGSEVQMILRNPKDFPQIANTVAMYRRQF